MTQTKAFKLALEVIQDYVDEYWPHDKDSGAQYTITAIKKALQINEQEPQPPYEFDRYVAGSLRAQGVRVERATLLADAIRIAVKICPPANPPSFPTVLVYKAPLVQAQPEQEPAWYHAECNDPDHSGFFKEAIDAVTQVNEHGGFVTKLYTTPPQRTWVGLTTDEYDAAIVMDSIEAAVTFVEAKLKEKNT